MCKYSVTRLQPTITNIIFNFNTTPFLYTFSLLKNSKEHTAKEYALEISKGNRMMLGRAITLCESKLPQHRKLANDILTLCLPNAGNSIRVGITGVPGVGKSTFIESLGMYLIGQGHKVAVLAVDPSSSRTKGSILGDKTRMEELSAHPQAFIRPSPSAGNLGGVATRTQECMLLCEAAGYDIILVETVGVGQSETEVKGMTDFFLLLMLAGAGDELQGIKRGIMEMADGVVINKADGDNLAKAKAARAEYAKALHLFPPDDAGHSPQVELCSAIEKTGINNVWKMVENHTQMLKTKNLFDERRNSQKLNWFEKQLAEGLLNAFFQQAENEKAITKAKQDILKGKVLPGVQAQKLIKSFIN
jgi:LAO/AO transport system kinase